MIVVLPGTGYTVQGPAISIPVLSLLEDDYDEPVSSIVYSSGPARPEEADFTAIEDAVLEEINATLSEVRPQRVVFVAKSFGTRVLGRIASRIALTEVRSVAAIWVTPLFGRPGRADEAIATGFKSLVIAGEADEKHYYREAHDRVVAELQSDQLVVPRANHGLEVPGDVRATVSGLSALADATLHFSQTLR
jgi:hypothetical protein